MKSGFLLLFTFFLGLISGNGQHSQMDSLQSLLKIAKQDTNKVNLLYQLSEICEEEDILKYATPALELAEKLHFKKGIANALNNIGYVLNNKGDKGKALEYHYRSLKIREEIRDREGIASSLNNIAVIYNNQGDIAQALTFHHRSLKTQQEIGNKLGVATSYDNIGFIYKNQGNTANALGYYYKSLKIYEAIGDKSGIATSYNNISSVYESQGDFQHSFEFDEKSLKVAEETGDKFSIARSLNGIGLYYSHQGDINKALEYFNRSIRINQETGSKASISTTLKNIGNLYREHGMLSDAFEYFEKSMKIQEEVGDKRLVAAILNDMGKIRLKQKDLDQAESYCFRALQIAKSIGNPQSIQGASGTLSEIYSGKKDYRKAYKMHVLFKQMADSVSNTEIRKSTVKKQMQYEFDKKEAVLKAEQEKKDALATVEIKRQTLIKNAILLVTGLVALFSFFLVWSYNRRKRIAHDMQVSQVEMKALRSQMNPHFIFNSLHSINKYMVDNDKEKASEYLSKFSKLMRLILENSREQEVPLEDDLLSLKLYMELEALRHKNRFKFVVDVDPEIDIENTLIPPMLLQPFVENSIIHGLPNKDEGLINIRIMREGSMIRCVVEDNGVGRKQSVKIETGEEKKRESLGMKITQERLHIINHLKKLKAAINIFDLKDAENAARGLRIEVLLPYQEAF